LSRATQTRYAFDLADSEIVFIAVRNGPLEQVTKDVKKVSQLVTDYGLRTPNKTRFVMSSLDFHKSPVLSALVPPIALWPLDVDLRARLLSNDLMLRCEYDADIWDKVFEQYGMRLSASEGAWVISRGTHRLHFGRVDVRRIRDSVGLGGLSPSALAKRLSDEIDRTN
jgi:hypothetical protein